MRSRATGFYPLSSTGRASSVINGQTVPDTAIREIGGFDPGDVPGSAVNDLRKYHVDRSRDKQVTGGGGTGVEVGEIRAPLGQGLVIRNSDPPDQVIRESSVWKTEIRDDRLGPDRSSQCWFRNGHYVSQMRDGRRQAGSLASAESEDINGSGGWLLRPVPPARVPENKKFVIERRLRVDRWRVAAAEEVSSTLLRRDAPVTAAAGEHPSPTGRRRTTLHHSCCPGAGRSTTAEGVDAYVYTNGLCDDGPGPCNDLSWTKEATSRPGRPVCARRCHLATKKLVLPTRWIDTIFMSTYGKTLQNPDQHFSLHSRLQFLKMSPEKILGIIDILSLSCKILSLQIQPSDCRLSSESRMTQTCPPMIRTNYRTKRHDCELNKLNELQFRVKYTALAAEPRQMNERFEWKSSRGLFTGLAVSHDDQELSH
ncbi:unnamed protein product [Soboliphyme baturini]|uniref:Uncharacterized protein n=1 Tax=Soboliphyme baturini TaxID=241478 RepID=A0A183IUG6_9BILA|nr:unnamed protein product [Soboliphyme baturini]